ncbi:MAG: polysaccharide biosynthesis/export family protein [Verrucomicrobiota bacterium]
MIPLTTTAGPRPSLARSRYPAFVLCAMLLIARGGISAAGAPAAETTSVTNPEYVLTAGDTIVVVIDGEPELRTANLIAQDGTVRLPLVGGIRLEGLPVRQAEALLAKGYREGLFLRNPEVHVQVTEYAARLVSVLGAVRIPGKVAFPKERKQIEIIDAITQSGGFLAVAKGDAVVVTHTDAAGHETQRIVDVTALMSGKRKDDKPAVIFVQPGDRIFVPERLF